MLNLMLDIETLGRGPGCVVTSVAITPFTMTEGIVHPTRAFKRKLSIAEQVILGLSINQDTHAWWMEQDPKVRESEFSGVTSPERFAIDFKEYLEGIKQDFGGYRLWATAPKLDFGCLYTLCTKAGKEYPVIYSWERCARTLRELTKELYSDFKLPYGKVTHCAEDDTVVQVNHAKRCYCKLKKSADKSAKTSGTGKAVHRDIREHMPEIAIDTV